MKKSVPSPLNPIALLSIGLLFGALMFACLFSTPASAQTSPTPPAQTPAAPNAPLNLDSDVVAKEMSKEQHATDTKPATFSTSDSAFAQSILDSENRKKVSGYVEAGAGVGTIPSQRGYPSQRLNCENTAVAVTDEISKDTQIGVAAQVSTCNVR